MPRLNRRFTIVLSCFLTLLIILVVTPSSRAQGPIIYLPLVVKPSTTAPATYSIVFVSRQIPPEGSIYWDAPKQMPGVGPYSRFNIAAPGQLVVREANGALRVLVDGNKPGPASLHLIDVNAPDVSYDGKTLVFAGLRAGNYEQKPNGNPNGWRIYTINVDGSGLRQVTFSDQNLNLAARNLPGGLKPYDDTDPAWLPDGRIVFSSTRWPSYAQYSGVRTTNLYVVKANGSGLRRITAERNGADRPLVDPITGKIVYARWWRNHRFAVNSMATVTDPGGGYRQHLGLTMDRTNHLGGTDNLWRNAWHAAAINPDGTGLIQWGGNHHKSDSNHLYGGAFMLNGDLIANYFPMANMSESAGFGGLRRYKRGAGHYTPILGITYPTLNYVHPSNPTSFGIFKGAYASEPYVLPDGRLVLSWAPDINQDYGLYTANANGSNLTPLYNRKGTAELRAQVIRARPLPPIIPDKSTQTASLLPPPAAGPYNQDGVFVFNALNIYANGPVDSEIESAPPVGSAATIRFFIDHQRQSGGSFPTLDWPILLGERPVAPDGSVKEPNAPANVPLFEQLRSSQGTVPRTGGPYPTGAGHVAGMNFAPPGTVATCVGCHAGHTMIPVPANPEAAKWSNLAPGAQVTVSSARDSKYTGGVIDRLVLKGEISHYWTSSPSKPANGQWVKLAFPVPVTVRAVRLYNPRQGDEANSTLQVQKVTVQLFQDAAGTIKVGEKIVNQKLSVSGTEVKFSDIRARVVYVKINSVSGTFYGQKVAGLAEIEVIARGE